MYKTINLPFKYSWMIFVLCFFIESFLSAQPIVDKTPFQTFQKQTIQFEENKGQVLDMNNQPASYVKYHYQKDNMHIFMLSTGIAYQFNKQDDLVAHQVGQKYPETKEQLIDLEEGSLETYRMDMQLIGANPNPMIIAEGKSQDYVNYYNHNVLGVHSFSKLIYKDVYANIDWVIYTTDKGLKYDFVVHPGANVNQIKIQFKHQESLQLNQDGSLTLSSSMGYITEQAPISFQEDQEIATAFKLHGDQLTFELADYNPTKKLIVDPSLIWATYYGGNDQDLGYTCTVDDNGNVYLAGRTRSTNAIASGGHQNTYGGGTIDAYLVKFNSSGVRQWATYYGGNANEIGRDCATDANGNVYLAGITGSTNNIASGGHQNVHGGGVDAFLVKFNSNGVRQWATYYGGSADDHAYACAVDNNGNVVLGGDTESTANIFLGGHQSSYEGASDAFLVKFNSNGVRQWATYYGGSGSESTFGCAVDNNNNIFLTGITRSTNHIASSGHQNTHGGGLNDVFLVKFNSNGVRQWGTYYGGTNAEYGYGCSADDNDNVFLAGFTRSFNNIASGGHQNTHAGGTDDAFLVKFNSNGVRQWGTYYGGSAEDYGVTCAVDNLGNVLLAGETYSSSNIAINGYQNTYGGSSDAFFVKFDPNGVRQWGSYFGGSNRDYSWDCAVDAANNIYLMGDTESLSNIALAGHQNSYGGGTRDSYLAKFQDATTILAVDVLDFKAQRITMDKVLVEWQVKEADIARAFFIERSFSTTFEVITKLDHNEHSFVDEINTNSILYYRLKILEQDGTITYSPIRAVEGNKEKGTILIYPNPVQHTLHLTNNEWQTIAVHITDLSGKLVLPPSLLTQGGTTIDVSSLPSGVYLFTIQADSGARIMRKFVKE